MLCIAGRGPASVFRTVLARNLSASPVSAPGCLDLNEAAGMAFLGLNGDTVGGTSLQMRYHWQLI
jgi:hypothetical protein